jgi:hypothetical protein
MQISKELDRMRKEISRHLHGSAKEKPRKKNLRMADVSQGPSYVRYITIQYEDMTESKHDQ